MEIKVGLIKGRHEMPVEEYIFDEVQDVFDFAAMEKKITNFLQEKVGVTTHFGCCINQADDVCVEHFESEDELVVYVTGLTAVTAELIRVCMLNEVRLTLMHYDRDTDSYRTQRIW